MKILSVLDPFLCLINQKYTIKYQWQILFVSISFISACITLLITYGILFTFPPTAYDSAKSIAISQLTANSLTLSKQVASSIDIELQSIGNSIASVSATYSTVLIQYSSYLNNGSILRQQSSYKHFNFQYGCKYPNCPQDYGSLIGRSRLPLSYLTRNNLNGSIKHTSTYLYSNTLGYGSQNDSQWSKILSKHTTASVVLNGLAIQDQDLSVMYNHGPNSTVMFYSAAAILRNGVTSAYSIFRSFPGTQLNLTDSFDPSDQKWFKKAPTNGLYLYGPFVEPSTGDYVVSLSCRDSSTVLGKSSYFNAVTGAVVSISTLREMINNIEYKGNGFGALVRYETHEVLVWKNETGIYNAKTSNFYTIFHYDELFAEEIISFAKSIEYTDANKTEWIVSVAPFFNSTTFSNSEPNMALVYLVFTPKEEAYSILNTWNRKTYSTIDIIVIVTAIIIGLTIIIIWFVILAITNRLTFPFKQMMILSEEINQVTAKDDKAQNYSHIYKIASQELKNQVGDISKLTFTFYEIIELIFENSNKKKVAIINYPKNPFYMTKEQRNDLVYDWVTFKIKAIQYGITNTLVDTSRISNRSNKSFQSNKSYKSNNSIKLIENEKGDELKPIEIEENSPRTSNITDQSNSNNNKYDYNSVPTTTIIKYEEMENGELIKNNNLQIVKAERNKRKFTFSSITFSLIFISSLLFLGLIASMLFATLVIRFDVGKWINNASDTLENNELNDISTLLDLKAIYMKATFTHISIDVLTASNYFTSIMNQNILYSTWEKDLRYLTSYSIDADNPYISSVSSSYNYSGYFIPSAAYCYDTTDNCKTSQNSTGTHLTSLLDLKLRSYITSGNMISYIQIGLDQDGLTRYLPYRQTSASNPTSCKIQSTNNQTCLNKYITSKCSSDSYSSYPAYDVRCRKWYNYAIQSSTNDPTKSYFILPRVDSNDEYVLTGVTPIRSTSSSSSALFGVFSINYLVSSFSTSLNSITLLSSGYIYMIDTTNTSQVIIHPDLTSSSSCQFVYCIETEFTDEEYQLFYNNILLPIQQNENNIPTKYKKGNKLWLLKYNSFQVSTGQYTLIATVPYTEVVYNAHLLHKSYETCLFRLMILFAMLLILTLLVLIICNRRLYIAYNSPLDHLNMVLQQIKESSIYPSNGSLINPSILVDPNDLTAYNTALNSRPRNTSKKHPRYQFYKNSNKNKTKNKSLPILNRYLYTSYDVKQFAEMITLLGSLLQTIDDRYINDNLHIAHSVYSEALEIFNTKNNKIGIGNCMNKLGIIEMKLDNYRAAEAMFNQSILNSQELLDETILNNDSMTINDNNNEYILELKRLHSDRQGNLAKLYLKENNFSEAIRILTWLFEEDSQNNYIFGLIRKQSLLGQAYLRINDFKNAKIIFDNSINFITFKINQYENNDQNVDQNNDKSDMIELAVAEQLALFNLAILQNKSNEDLQVIVNSFLIALISTPYMNINTTKKILISLRIHFSLLMNAGYVNDIDNLAKEFNIELMDMKQMIVSPYHDSGVLALESSSSGSVGDTAIGFNVSVDDFHNIKSKSMDI
eukprot:gene15339-20670_t